MGRERVVFGDRVSATVDGERVAPCGIFRVKVIDTAMVVGSHYRGPLMEEFEFPNLVVNVGRTYISGSALLGVSPDSTYFVGLTAGSPTIAASDTMSSHAGWTELTGFSQSTRPAFVGVAGGTAGNVNSSASPAVFSINAGSQTLGGAFIVGDNTKGGSTGTLIAVGSLSNFALPNPSTINVSYDFSWA